MSFLMKSFQVMSALSRCFDVNLFPTVIVHPSIYLFMNLLVIEMCMHVYLTRGNQRETLLLIWHS